MKKLLITAIAILGVVVTFHGCTKDDKEEFPNIPKDELAFVGFKFELRPATSDDDLFNGRDSYGKLYTQDFYLFKLDGKHLAEGLPRPKTFESGRETLCVIHDVNGELILADFSTHNWQNKDINTGKYILKGTVAVYNNEVTGRLKKGRYLIVVNTLKSYFCKIIDISPQNKYEYYNFVLIQTKMNDKIDDYIWF